MPVPYFINYTITSLASDITTTDTTLTLTEQVGFPTTLPIDYYFYAVIHNGRPTTQINEIIKVTNINNLTWTIERGQIGTTAKNWRANESFIEPIIIDSMLLDTKAYKILTPQKIVHPSPKDSNTAEFYNFFYKEHYKNWLIFSNLISTWTWNNFLRFKNRNIIYFYGTIPENETNTIYTTFYDYKFVVFDTYDVDNNSVYFRNIEKIKDGINNYNKKIKFRSILYQNIDETSSTDIYNYLNFAILDLSYLKDTFSSHTRTYYYLGSTYHINVESNSILYSHDFNAKNKLVITNDQFLPIGNDTEYRITFDTLRNKLYELNNWERPFTVIELSNLMRLGRIHGTIPNTDIKAPKFYFSSNFITVYTSDYYELQSLSSNYTFDLGIINPYMSDIFNSYGRPVIRRIYFVCHQYTECTTKPVISIIATNTAGNLITNYTINVNGKGIYAIPLSSSVRYFSLSGGSTNINRYLYKVRIDTPPGPGICAGFFIIEYSFIHLRFKHT